jgi:hypothetical protein
MAATVKGFGHEPARRSASSRRMARSATVDRRRPHGSASFLRCDSQRAETCAGCDCFLADAHSRKHQAPLRTYNNVRSSHLESCDSLFLAPEYRSKPHTSSGFDFKQAFIEPASPSSRPTGLPTHTVNLATLFGAHGRLRGKEAGTCRSLSLLYSATPVPRYGCIRFVASAHRYDAFFSRDRA